jgi:hypothetical protein
MSQSSAKRTARPDPMDLPPDWSPLDDYDPVKSERVARSPRDTGFPPCECGRCPGGTAVTRAQVRCPTCDGLAELERTDGGDPAVANAIGRARAIHWPRCPRFAGGVS